MSVQVIQNALSFLDRVQITGAEAEAMVQVKQFLAATGRQLVAGSTAASKSKDSGNAS